MQCAYLSFVRSRASVGVKKRCAPGLKGTSALNFARVRETQAAESVPLRDLAWSSLTWTGV